MNPDTLIRVAAGILPSRRAEWARAMERELMEEAPGFPAFAFALGCVFAAVIERTRPMQMFVKFGRWAVAAVTAFYGLIFLYAAFNAATIMTWGAERYIQHVGKNHIPASAAQSLYDDMPMALAVNLGTGLAYLAVAWFLARWQVKPFLASLGAVAVFLLVYTVPGVFGDLSSGVERLVFFAIPFALVGGAAAVFSMLAQRAAQRLA